MKKIDEYNNLSSPKPAKDLAVKDKVVGIKIDTDSQAHQSTVYYYKTAKDLKVGDKINPVMVTGGKPDCVVVSVGNVNSSSYKRLKELEF